MPLEPIEAPGIFSRIDAPRPPETPDEIAAADSVRPALTDTLAASWRTQNEVGSLLSKDDIPDPSRVEPDFSSFDFVKGTQFEGDDDFTEVFNKKAAETLIRQKERERTDRRTVEASGWVGVVSDIATGTASPTILMPGGALVRGVKGGYAVGRAALSVGASAAAAAAVQEGLLHGSQYERTKTETGFAIGASALLGGFIGGGAAAFLTKAERRAAEKAVGDLTGASVRGGSSPFGASGGAAAVSDVGVGDLDIAGRAARAVAEGTAQLNPTLRLNTSPSQAARLYGQQLGENSLYQAGNDLGITAGPAVERLAANTFHGRLYEAEKALDDAYKGMVKAGTKMTRRDFEEAVGKAARRNDQGENEFVSRAAKAYRSTILDPFKNEAIAARLLPEDVQTLTSDSYLHRMWDFQKLTAREADFKRIAQEWVERTLPREADLTGFRDAKDLARQVADEVYDKLTGRQVDISTQGLSITLGPRGPLKERSFQIPDSLVEDFLNNNIVEVGRRYGRLMSGDVELTKRFGSVDLKEPKAKITDEYRGLRERVQEAQNLDEIREITGKGFKFEGGLRKVGGGRTDARVKEKALEYLAKREKGDLRDLDGLRDLIRGTYGVQNADGAWNRVSRAASQINYIRLMGGVIVASIGDIYRPAMVHGLLPFMRDGIRPLLTHAGRAAAKMAREDAKRFGLVVERYTQGRLSTFAEIGDPYRRGTAVERLLEAGTRVGSRWNGILLWTDAMKGITSVMSQDRIVRGVLGEGDDRFLAYLGINRQMKARISQQIADHGEELDGVWVAHVADWTDAEAARTYGAALGKDVDSVIVTKSVGDVPLFANTPTGRVLMQFKSFALASHQKVLLRGLQESPARFLSGMVGMTALGMLAAYARAWRGGKDRFERFTAAAENPGYLIGEALDLTGIFALPMEAANIGEKIFQRNVVKDPLKAAFPDRSQQGSSLRYQSRGVASSLLGPSAGLVDLATEFAGMATLAAAGEPTDKQKKRLVQKGVQLVPYYSYPGMREMINKMLEGM